MPMVCENLGHATPQVSNHHIQEGGGFESPLAHPSGSGIDRGDPGFEPSFAHRSTLGAERAEKQFESPYAHLRVYGY